MFTLSVTFVGCLKLFFCKEISKMWVVGCRWICSSRCCAGRAWFCQCHGNQRFKQQPPTLPPIRLLSSLSVICQIHTLRLLVNTHLIVLVWISPDLWVKGGGGWRSRGGAASVWKKACKIALSDSGIDFLSLSFSCYCWACPVSSVGRALRHCFYPPVTTFYLNTDNWFAGVSTVWVTCNWISEPTNQLCQILCW
jgi:hypothetical protein